MPIDFFEILADEDWTPLAMDLAGSADRWHEGGPLSDAPVDVAATFAGNVWVSTAMDPEFRMQGLRLAPDFAVPRRSHNQHKLIIVLDGTIDVSYTSASAKEVSEQVSGPGGFFVIDEATPHTLTAGPDGARFTEQWDYDPPAELETTWYDAGWIRR